MKVCVVKSGDMGGTIYEIPESAIDYWSLQDIKENGKQLMNVDICIQDEVKVKE